MYLKLCSAPRCLHIVNSLSWCWLSVLSAESYWKQTDGRMSWPTSSSGPRWIEKDDCWGKVELIFNLPHFFFIATFCLLYFHAPLHTPTIPCLHSPASYSGFRNQPPDISDVADQNGGQTVIIPKYIVLKGLSGVIWENLLKMCLSKKDPDIPAILQGSTLFLFVMLCGWSCLALWWMNCV